MKTFRLHFSNGLIETVQGEELYEVLAKIKSVLHCNRGFTTEFVPGKILNLNQLVSVRELEEWELYDNNTP